jgi:hypothetical protein
LRKVRGRPPYQIVEFQFLGQKPIQLLITEPTIRQDQDFNIRRQRFGQTPQHTILKGIPMILQRCLVNREPHQRRRAAMVADQRQHNRRLIIGIKVGPVHGNNNIRARPNRMGDPSLREFVNVNPRVGEHPIHLLDGMLGQFSPRQCQPLSDRVHRQRGAAYDPKRGVRQRINSLGMNILAK